MTSAINNLRFHNQALRIHFLDHGQAVTVRTSDRRWAVSEAKKYLYDNAIVSRPTNRQQEATLLGRIKVSRVRLGESVAEGLAPEGLKV